MKTAVLVCGVALLGCATTSKSLVGRESDELDAQLRSQLARCGMKVVDTPTAQVVTLMPKLTLTSEGVSLRVLALRGVDQQLMGDFILRATGSTRERQIKGVASRICAEVSALKPRLHEPPLVALGPVEQGEFHSQ